mmetsp:Transcript_7708/g.10951  ORF Transcript_7708/g.10951 Transcript_7708/m.10951 type:complete len:704 (-) Transcript_7708:219-2330(-)
MSQQCDLCLSDEDQDKIVSCHSCHLAIHVYCLCPTLPAPLPRWLCQECAERKAKANAKKNLQRQQQTPTHVVPDVPGMFSHPNHLPTLRVSIAAVRSNPPMHQQGIQKNTTILGNPQSTGSKSRITEKKRALKNKSAPVKKVKRCKKTSALSGTGSGKRRKMRSTGSKAASQVPSLAQQSSGFLSAVSPLLLEASSLSSAAEEKLLRQALENSKVCSQVRVDLEDIPEAPVFRPTPEEFADPIRYIRGLHPIGEKWGIVRVEPPKSWSPGFHIDSKKYRFNTRKQHVHKLQEAQGFDEGKSYTLSEYRDMARAFEFPHLASLGVKTAPPGAHEKDIEAAEKLRQIRNIERRYWQIVTTGTPQVEVEYGNDVDSGEVGSGFSKEGKGEQLCNPGSQGWNLNKIAILEDSPLCQLPKGIQGVTVPWVYCGMLFSSFCWHTEDNYLPSINYLHKGAPKVWYAAPSQHAKGLEGVMKSNMPLLFHREPDLMQKLVTMLDPSTLIAHGVPVCRGVQREGTFVITFPRGYHCGFNSGFNVAEAVNLAYDEWFPYGRQCVKRYRERRRASVFPHDWLLLRTVEQRHRKRLAEGKSGALDAEDAMLRRELRALFEEEGRLRKKLKKAGVYNVELMPTASKGNRSSQQEAEPKCRQCHMCNQHCYLSHMTCFCPGQQKVVCLHHIRYLCACKPSNKVLFVRNLDRSMIELQN